MDGRSREGWVNYGDALLEDVCEEARERIAEPRGKRDLAHVREHNFPAPLEVERDLGVNSLRRLFVVENSVHFVVELQTADIEIGRAHGTDLPIDRDHLRVHKALLVLKDFDPRLEEFVEIGEGRPVSERIVPHARHENGHGESAHGRRLESREQALGRHKVR